MLRIWARRRTAAVAVFTVLLGGVVVVGPTVAASAAPPAGLVSTFLEDGSPQLAWDPADGASAYKVEIATSPAFATGQIVTSKSDITTPQWVPERTLSTAAGRELYWRVTANNETSATETLTLPPLPVATLVAPAQGAALAYPTPVSFSWNAVPGAVSYTLEYSSDNFTSATTTVSDLTATSYTPTVPLSRTTENGADITWTWHVKASFYTGTTVNEQGAYSPASSFQVTWPSAVSAPTLTAPANGVTTAFSDLKFTWDPVAGASKYQFSFGADKTSDGSSILAPTVVDVVGTVYVPTLAMLDDSYFWQVRAYDANGKLGQPSEVFEVNKTWGNQSGPSFVAGSDSTYPRPLVGSTTIANAEQMTLDGFELRWEPLARATFYEVMVYPTNGDAPLTCRTPSTSATIVAYAAAGGGASSSLKGSDTCLWVSAKAKRIQVGGTYRWMVRGVDYSGSSTVNYQATTYPAGTLFSEWSDPQQGDVSRARYVSVVASTASGPLGGVALDHDALSAQMSPALVGQPAPVLSWSRFDYLKPVDTDGDGIDDDGELASADGYQVRVFADAQRTNLIATVRTPSTRIRINGVFQANTTSASYYADVRPLIESDNMTNASSVTFVGDATADTFYWTRTTTPLDLGTSPVVTRGDGTVILSWQPQSVTGALDGGSRGYRISVTNASGTAVDAGAKIEYPWFVASYPVTGKPLPDGSYQFTVQPLDANGDPGRATASVPFTVSTPVPGGTAEQVSGSSATFAWTPTASAQKYQLQYWSQATPATVYSLGSNSTSLNPATDIRQTALTAAASQSKLATPTLLVPGTYLWQVRSVDTSGNPSAWTQARSFTIPSRAPTLVTADGTAFIDQPRTLHWEVTPGASRYVVQVSSDPSFPQSSTTTSVETIATTIAVPGTLAYGTRYYWRVRAVAEPSVASPTAARVILGESAARSFTAVSLPKAVTLGTVKVDGTKLTIPWTVLSTEATAGDVPESLRYRVQYRKVGDEWDAALVHQNDAQREAAWTTPALEESTSYEVRVAAVNRIGQGPWSTTKTVKTASVPTAAPTITVTPGNASLVLRLGSVSANGNGGSAITGYRITYAKVGATGLGSVDIPVSQKTYTLSGLAPLTAYDLEVSALNAVGAGPVSTGSWTTLGNPTAPRTLKAKATSGRVALTWAAPASDGGSSVTGYTVQRRTGSGAWTTVSSRTSSTSYAVSGLKNGTSYGFRVAAITKVAAAGAWSAVVTVTPAAVPGAPTKVKVKATKGKYTVSWKKAAANGSKVTKYYVQYSTNGTKWKKLKTLKAAKVKYATKVGKKGKTTYFRVIAQNGVGKSVPSARVSAVKK